MQQNERAGIDVKQPQKIEERNDVATVCAKKLNLSIPFVVDTLDNKVEEHYAGWPDRMYVVDQAGKIAYKGAPGPRGFKVDEMTAALQKLLK